MPTSRRRKPKKNSSRSPVDSHRRTGKTLIPPAISALGEKLQFTSWMNDRLPEMLWAALIFASTERRQAFREFERILSFVAGHDRKAELKSLTISNFADLDPELRREVIEVITANPTTSRALAALLKFEGLPARREWEEYLLNHEANLDLLMSAVGNTLFQQSPGATDCRWVWVASMAAAGQMNVHRDLTDYVERMDKYPYLEPGAPEGGSVRSSEGGLAPMVLPKSDWPEVFWREAWEKSPCFQLATPSLDEGVQPSTTKPIPRWDVHFGDLDDDRKDSTAPHITFSPQLGRHRQCGLAICTFHLGFSLVLQPRFGGKAVADPLIDISLLA